MGTKDQSNHLPAYVPHRAHHTTDGRIQSRAIPFATWANSYLGQAQLWPGPSTEALNTTKANFSARPDFQAIFVWSGVVALFNFTLPLHYCFFFSLKGGSSRGIVAANHSHGKDPRERRMSQPGVSGKSRAKFWVVRGRGGPGDGPVEGRVRRWDVRGGGGGGGANDKLARNVVGPSGLLPFFLLLFRFLGQVVLDLSRTGLSRTKPPGTHHKHPHTTQRPKRDQMREKRGEDEREDEREQMSK